MNEALDHVAILGHRARAAALGLAPRATRPRGVPRVADILSCTFDRARDVFHLVYVDLSSADLPRGALAEVGARSVVAWEVDTFRRGVEVVLHDGWMTSFSAEFPRYVSDEAYRHRVDARRGPAGQDLGGRLALRVREEREHRGWSVAELARRAEMAPPNVHRVEAGKHVPSMQTIVRLAAALGCSLERLLRAG